MDNRVILDLDGSLGGEGPDPALLATSGNVEPRLRPEGPVRATARVSLVIPTFFNRALKHGSLRWVLEGVSDSAAISEIILVASDGEDSEREHLQGLAGGAVRVVEGPPHNRARSRNLGVAAARGDFVLFVDDDMLPQSWRLVDVILSRMLEEGFQAALFPPRQYLRFPALFDPSFLDWKIREWRSGKLAGDCFLLDPVARGGRDLPMYFCFPGCFTLMSRAAYERLGGFDERYVGWGFEDTEFALRAARELRVLNLFRETGAFLHIDHAVSPYKSEEHQENSRRFFAEAERIDVMRLCRRVLAGDHFQGDTDRILGGKPYLEPFESVAALGIPLRVEEIEPWCDMVARGLVRRFSDAVPRFVVLHGSRASGGAAPGADFDVLCLYAGPVQDFYVTRAEPRVELECVSTRVFEAMADGHVAFDSRAVFELSKIAQARLLWGDAPQWEAWRNRMLSRVVPAARVFWLVLGLGLRLHARKLGPVADRYAASLGRILNAADGSGAAAVADALASPGLERLAEVVAAELARAVPDWRRRLAGGERIFELQIPEVWAALYWLADRNLRIPERGEVHAAS